MAKPAITFWHPAHMLATWFGLGLLPKAPGTWGSLGALPFAWFINSFYGWPGLLFASVIVFALGIWASGFYGAATSASDPGEIVIDEVAGQWLALVFAGQSLLLYAIGFILFRLADIFKPWPASWADRKVKGGFGVMLDDMIAGVYAGLGVYGCSFLL